jgi:hypothetical protein
VSLPADLRIKEDGNHCADSISLFVFVDQVHFQFVVLTKERVFGRGVEVKLQWQESCVGAVFKSNVKFSFRKLRNNCVQLPLNGDRRDVRVPEPFNRKPRTLLDLCGYEVDWALRLSVQTSWVLSTPICSELTVGVWTCDGPQGKKNCVRDQDYKFHLTVKKRLSFFVHLRRSNLSESPRQACTN